jgi:DNA-binding response OmpR family regulator
MPMSEPTMALVVAEDPDLRQLCRVALEADGLTVMEATDGSAVLGLLGHHRPDVVLLEVTPAGPDGWRTLAEIRAQPATCDLPVVLLSPRDQEADREGGWTRGATDHLAWPFAPLAVSQVVQDALATDPADAQRRRRAALERPSLLRAP